ncbi:MAG: hypothetical protein MI922_12235 [Bacteroidales bacterium]|nr:hypothetical protein [Bacteroidales bacterium]
MEFFDSGIYKIFIDLVIPVLTASAFIFAAIQFYQDKKRKEKLEEIYVSLSTKYIGVFPGYLPKLIESIESAEKEITILCDFPCYGLFSNHSYYIQYCSALQNAKAKSNVKISMNILNKELREKMLNEQFEMYDGTDSNKNWKKRYYEPLKIFKDHYLKDKSMENISFKDLSDALLAINDKTIDTFQSIMSVKEIASNTSIFYWIIDKKMAIFSIPSFTQADSEMAFYTEDPKLISSFQEINKGMQEL